jgi:hypothetical protein
MRLLRYLILFGRYRAPGDKDPPEPKDEKPAPSAAEEKDDREGGLSEPQKLR